MDRLTAGRDRHEREWAVTLAREQAHQRELLAVFSGELGAFARECAAALAALDVYIDDLAQLAGAGAPHKAWQHAKAAYDHGARAAEVARRVRTKTTIVHAESPAASAAVEALGPLDRWESLAGVDLARAGRELANALEGAPLLQLAGRLTGLPVAEATELADALRDAAAHLGSTAETVEQGRLPDEVARVGALLRADLEELRGLLDAGGPADRQAARGAELAELREEVREKLERIERTRRLLGMLLPRLRAVARALGEAEKLQRAQEGELDPRPAATADAARLWLLLEISLLRGTAVAPTAAHRARRRPRTRWVVAAALVVAGGAGAAIGLSLGGGSEKAAVPPPPPTSAPAPAAPTPPPPSPKPRPKPPPQPPVVSPVKAVFVEGQRATFYSAAAATTERATYSWRLTPPRDDPDCTKFAVVAGKPNEAVWHHADTDGCSHFGSQHLGVATVTITTPHWQCTAQFLGTLTRTGPPPQSCRRR